MSLEAIDRFAEEFRRRGGEFPEDMRFEVPERFNFARDVLDGFAEDPGKLALWWVSSSGDERKVTFAEVAEESRRVCNVLTAAGIERGDVVVVLLPRVPEWWVVNVACLRMGVVISPAPAQVREADIAYRLERCGATCVIAHDSVADRVDASGAAAGVRCRLVVGAPRSGWRHYGSEVDAAAATFDTADTASDDTAAVYFTSGTEGPPKMVAHTHVSFPLRSRLTGMYWLDLNDGDLHWNLSDTGWAKAGWSSLYGPWNHGAAAFAVDSPRFDPVRVLDLLKRFPVDTLCAPPTVYRALLAHVGFEPSIAGAGAGARDGDEAASEPVANIETRQLRHCVAAGEPLNPEVIEGWRALTGITIRDGFGQTESSLLAVNFPGAELRPGSMGKPVPGYTVAIIDDDGNSLGPGIEGDLAVRAAPRRPLGLCKEYVDDPQATAKARRGDWHVTGDRAYHDDDGYFWYVGRADDVIISSGYRIGPFEVESALLEHAAVAESAVVSTPHEVRGEVVKAFVVLMPGSEPTDALVEELQDHVKSVTAPYKYPRRMEFVESLPKTSTGKIKRAALRDAEWKRNSG